MKKIFIFFVMAFAILSVAYGQNRELQIFRGGSIIQSYNVASIDSVKIVTIVPLDDHSYVDLGLPSGTLWATCNVGATSPEEYGNYYAWGETATKGVYDWSTYKWGNGSGSITKYTGSSSSELELSDDVAYVNWGKKWRMPSEAQFSELINSNYTTTEWTTMSGVYGRKITSKKNGNTIFLPAAGYRYGSSLNDTGSYGYYWSRTLNVSNSSSAKSLYFGSGNIYMYGSNRYYGQSVRPVRFSDVMMNSITLNYSTLNINVGSTAQLTATVSPSNATNKSVSWTSSNTSVATVNSSGIVTGVSSGTCTITATARDGSGKSASCTVTVKQLVTGMSLNYSTLKIKVGSSTQLTATVSPSNASNKSVSWTSSNTNVATVSSNGLVTGVSSGTCTITATAKDGSGKKASCVIMVDGSGTIDGHAYVDLGLPSGTLWATCNVGASNPEGSGYYCAWGETGEKSTYYEYQYKYYSSNKYIKYTESDNKTELELSDDAAYVKWGKNWRMPSEAQFKELIDSRYTDTEWTTLNGKYGLKIISNKNGNTIFLLAAGLKYSSKFNSFGSEGCYWSRSLRTELSFNSNRIETASMRKRYYGQSVRPVRFYEVTDMTLNYSTLSISPSYSAQLTATVSPSNATDKSVSWSCSNTKVATVNSEGLVTGVSPGICTITAMAKDGSGKKATCVITVDYAYVDLGLPSGTLWATCNVGAKTPEGYGNYYAWGVTNTTYYYNWSYYKYCNGSSTTLTKYNNDSSKGTVDNKTELELSDDAAYVNWGQNWRMPSNVQFQELVNSSYTTTEWTTMNGVYGRKITSKKNGKYIFLPAAGYRNETSLKDAGSVGYYWSRSLYTDPAGAWILQLNSDLISGTYYSYARYYGRSVRPVRFSE